MTFDVTILKKELGLADDCDNCQRRDSKFTGCENEAWAIVCDRLNQLAEDIPMIEYVPVRHGHWVNVVDEYVGAYKLQKMLRCSECNYEVWVVSDEMNPNYCSNCGAKMSDEYDE